MTRAPKPRVWQTVEVVADAQLADAIGAFLLDRGAPGLQTEERGHAAIITAHFESSVAPDEVETFFDALGEIFPDAGRPEASFSSIEETAWAENWKEHFPALEIGDRLFVHPPWVGDIPAGRVAVELDPGMAFGTGQHGSTRGCLAALDGLIAAGQAARVLDLGTGSGILAIAAVKLGAASVLAVDVDAEACEIAAVNAATNRVADKIEITTRLEHERSGFDVIVANLFSGMLIGFANDIARRLRPGGYAVGAGLVSSEASGVIDAWTETGMARVRELEVEGWTTVVFRNAPRT